MNLADAHARDLVELAAHPSPAVRDVVGKYRDALLHGAAALEREARQKEHDEAMERAADDTRPIGPGKR